MSSALDYIQAIGISRVHGAAGRCNLQQGDQINVSGYGSSITTEVIYKSDEKSVDTMIWLRGGFNESKRTVTEHRYTPDGKSKILGSFRRGSREHHSLLDKFEEEESQQGGTTQ